MYNILFIEGLVEKENEANGDNFVNLTCEYQYGKIIPVPGMIYKNAYVVDSVLIYTDFDALLNKDTDYIKRAFKLINDSLLEDYELSIEYIDVICFIHLGTKTI